MILTKTDKKFDSENFRETVALMKRYEAFTGKRWPPYNYEQRDYRTMADWFTALKRAVEELELDSAEEL